LDEAIQCVSEMGKNLFIAFGDDVTSAEGSIKKAQARFLDEERVPLEQLR
jgi:hypothetical protein